MGKVILAGCVITQGESILLLHRKSHDWWELPGGHVEPGESPQQAAQRELREELACDVEIVQPLGGHEFHQEGRDLQYNWFLARIPQGQSPKVGEPEIFTQCRFVPFSELFGLRLSNNMRVLAPKLQTMLQ